MSLDQDLEKLEKTIAALIGNLSPASRARASSQIARTLRGSNAKRIASQRDPDGQAFTPKKAASPSSSPKGDRATKNATKKFLYPSGGSGAPRVVLLKSYHKSGPLLTGYDQEAEGIRSFERSKIIKYLAVTAAEQNKRARTPRTSVKSRIMFRKLRTFAHLRAGSNADEAWAGFDGRIAGIAAIHQEGGLDRAGPKAPLTRYPTRRLLGLSSDDAHLIGDMLLAMVSAQN